MFFSHRSLIAWQRADDLFLQVHRLTSTRFPTTERFTLTSQTRRAALSVPLNIVEGFARKNPRERLQFLRISWASLAELDYCLHVARRLDYLADAEHEAIEAALRDTAALLSGLIDKYARRVRTITPMAR